MDLEYYEIFDYLIPVFKISTSKNVVLVLLMNEAGSVGGPALPGDCAAVHSRSVPRPVAGLFSKECEFLAKESRKSVFAHGEK